MKKLIPSILLSLFSYPLAILFDVLIRLIVLLVSKIGPLIKIPVSMYYIPSVVFSLNIIALITALYIIHKSNT